MSTWFSSLLSLACDHEQPSRQHKLNVMTVHAPSNNGKYTKPYPVNHLLENINKLVVQWPSIDLSVSIVLKFLGLVVLNVGHSTMLLATSILSVCLIDLTQKMTSYNSKK